jgi:Fe-S-cluster containining protein
MRYGSVFSKLLTYDCSVSPEDFDILDCLTCGACCRTGLDGRILVPAEDLVRWKAIGRPDLVEQTVPGHFGERAFAYRPDGSCVHLGTPQNANACAIYDIRGTTCREFERGSPQCLEFRRDMGIDTTPRVRPTTTTTQTGEADDR